MSKKPITISDNEDEDFILSDQSDDDFVPGKNSIL